MNRAKSEFPKKQITKEVYDRIKDDLKRYPEELTLVEIAKFNKCGRSTVSKIRHCPSYAQYRQDALDHTAKRKSEAKLVSAVKQATVASKETIPAGKPEVSESNLMRSNYALRDALDRNTAANTRLANEVAVSNSLRRLAQQPTVEQQPEVTNGKKRGFFGM